MKIYLEYEGQSVEIETIFETPDFFKEKLISALRAINGENLADCLEKCPNTKNTK